MKKKFYQLDAFTDEPFGGNPAAVVLNAEDLDKGQMQKIAREMALSETAFVINSKVSDYDYEVRFFTPNQEVELCGHATIATFSILAQKGIIKPTDNKIIVKQKTLAGILPVELYFNENNISKIMMIQSKPKYCFTVNDTGEIASIMGISKDDVGLDGFKAEVMAYSTGLPDILLPVKSVDILKKISPDLSKLEKYSKDYNVVGVHAFTIKDYEKPLISCRNFAPAYGINEESATGTSNGALSAYLIKNGIIGIDKVVNITCEQGHFMNRPSQIFVEVIKDKEDIIVKVGGKAVLVMEGEIYL